MSSPPPRVAVLGGGPAGLMAAEQLAAAGVAVTLYDRMPSVGRKLLLAGRGGLNLTHSEPLPALLSRYGTAMPRLGPALEAFPPIAVRSWSAGLGQPTVVGSSGRVFPVAFKASPLLRAWLGRLVGLGVQFRLRHRWTGWDDAGRLTFAAADGTLTKAAADATLLAMGGASWPRLGSDGSWAATLRGAGIDVSPLAPANCGFETAWTPLFRDRFAGVPLKTIALEFAGQRVRGEAMITGYGIEGGAVYALSARLRDAIAAAGIAELRIDLRPDLAEAELARRLAGPRRRQSAANVLRKAAGLPPVAIGLLREAAGPALPLAADILARLIKSLPLRLTAPRGLERAISTAGGVAFAALDARFMLTARPGVFAAGEMLDWEAPTGGYLLQASFSTAVAAAAGILDYLDRSPASTASAAASPLS